MTTENAAPTPAGNEHIVVNTVPEKLPTVSHPHASKFRVAFGALAGIAFVALAVAVAVLVQGSGTTSAKPSAPWSSWAPTSSGSEGVTEIADFVAPYYRYTASQQLDAITPISVSESTDAGTTTGSGMAVVVNGSGSSKAQSLELLAGKTVAYNVCGLGARSCELPGKASTNRMLLLRREALELALYTFKYISGTQNVIAVLPPGHTQTASGVPSSNVTVAVLFERSELQSLLASPLSNTLSADPLDNAELSLWSKTDEAELVDEITAESLFSSQVEAQQEGGNLLVLSPLPAQ